MSIAEQLIQQGRQEGEQRGWLKGQIQLCQDLLGLSVMSAEELEKQEPAHLQRLLSDLQARLRQRMSAGA